MIYWYYETAEDCQKKKYLLYYPIAPYYSRVYDVSIVYLFQNKKFYLIQDADLDSLLVDQLLMTENSFNSLKDAQNYYVMKHV